MMILAPSPRVFLHRQPIDFRKQINGLSILVQDQLELDLFSDSMFVFINRARNRIKILYRQKNGFCLWLKRLEQDKFAWPVRHQSKAVNITTEQLQWLLEGFDIWRQPPHQTLQYASV